MSKMSELAIDIEEAIERGESVSDMVDHLVDEFKLSRAFALSLVNRTADIYREERGYEIH